MQSLFTVVLSTVERNRHDMFRLSAPVTLQALTAQHQALMQAILDGDPQRTRMHRRAPGACAHHHPAHGRRPRPARTFHAPAPDLTPTLLPQRPPTKHEKPS